MPYNKINKSKTRYPSTASSSSLTSSLIITESSLDDLSSSGQEKLDHKIKPKKVETTKVNNKKNKKITTPKPHATKTLNTSRKKSVKKTRKNPVGKSHKNSCSLVHRDFEYHYIFNFINERVKNNTSGCLYISGIPGTGKTATLLNVMDQFKDDPKICYIFINGLDYTNSKQVLAEIACKITQTKITASNALNYLDTYFSNKNRKSVIIVVDEFDHLCQDNQFVWYNICEWTTRSKASIIFITIANTIDLPERVMSKQISSRFGYERLAFNSYTFEQLVDIIQTKIETEFDSDALNLISRKTAAVSGDVRRCLAYCRSASEVARAENPHAENLKITIKHVEQAFQNDSKTKLISSLGVCSKILLKCIALLMGSKEETTFQEVYPVFISNCKNEETPPDSSASLRLLTSLSAVGIIQISLPTTLNSKIKLNIHPEMVVKALKDTVNTKKN